MGNPDNTTLFPAEMLVDYVRVYDKVGAMPKSNPEAKANFPLANHKEYTNSIPLTYNYNVVII